MVPVIDIAYDLNIYEIQAYDFISFEGCIVMPLNKSKGSIVVNAASSQSRQRFTIEHQLYHLLHSRHKPVSRDGNDMQGVFQCSSEDIKQRRYKKTPLTQYQKQEIQANQCSADLLTPRYKLKTKLR